MEYPKEFVHSHTFATHRFRLLWVCLEVLRRLLWPGRGYKSKAHQDRLRLWWSWAASALVLRALSARFYTTLCALDSCFSSFSLPGLRLQDVLEPDAVLVELAIKTSNHCSSCVFICGERSLYLLKKSDPERSSSSDGKGTFSSSTVPFRFRFHETFAASCLT